MNVRTCNVARWVAAAVIVLAALATVMRSASALPSSDPYEEVGSTSPTTYPRPDLTGSLRWEGVNDGQTGAFLGWRAILTVRNGGTRSAGQSVLSVRATRTDEFGNRQTASVTHNIPSLAAGRSFTIESLVVRPYCSLAFWAMVDSAKAVTESVETNNGVYYDAVRCW